MTKSPPPNTIFRIQDSDGRGPYRPNLTKTWCEYHRMDSKPGIFEEFGQGLVHILARHLLQNHGVFGCGFSSIESLQHWFTEGERKSLGRVGFELVVIIPDKVFAKSDKQVVFWCRKSLCDAPFKRISLVKR